MAIRAPLANLVGGERTLEPEPSHYLCRVLRLGVGDRFVAFDPEARTEADATVLVESASGARVVIAELRAARVVATAELVLVYALSKGDKVDDVVRDATELGATRVVVARTERAVVKLTDERARDKLDRWRRIVEQASRQCGRADPPLVDGVLDWRDALARASACATRLCLDPHATTPIGPDLLRASSENASIAFAIGPEGGLSPNEIDLARAAGFLPVSLGPFVLRTETVAAAVLGAVRALAPT